ncbi:MAG: serine/threonine-protein kinase [bacterium]
MKSTLIELPPELLELDEDSVDFSDAVSVEELAQKSKIQDEKVIQRLLLPGSSFGPYRILGFIAAGGMGEVYSAERVMPDGKRLGPVALKVIAPEYLGDWAITERFKREAQISRAIRSLHVTRVYEFGETPDKHAFLAMEMLHGEELFDRMYRRRFTPREVVEIILQVLAGLRAVHESGFIHRDIKPENIYFHRTEGGDEVVKILDFGIAKRRGEQSDPYLSVVGKIYGTPEYIAPEQGLNPDVDERADLYSVGVIMYELLAGRLPFEGETAYAIILAHQNQKPPALPEGIDRTLMRIVGKSLAKRSDDRYQSAADFAQDLRTWFNRSDARDTDDLLQRQRHDTPERALYTPSQGLPRAQPEPSDAESESDAPPVQIFSKRKVVEEPIPVAPPTSLLEPDPAPDPRQETAHGSKSAVLFTAAVVIAVAAVVIWVLMR